MKKVVALMGSPRKAKNTNIALDLVLNNMDTKEFEVNKVYLGNLDINPCIGCDYCGREEACIHKDDMDNLYDEFDSADIVILAAPVYFNSINSLSKKIIDRCQRYWSLKYTHGKQYKRNQNRKGICISVGGAPFTFDQFSGINPILDYFFRSLNVEHIGNYYISNTDRKPVNTRENVVEELENIGKNFNELEKFNIQR